MGKRYILVTLLLQLTNVDSALAEENAIQCYLHYTYGSEVKNAAVNGGVDLGDLPSSKLVSGNYTLRLYVSGSQVPLDSRHDIENKAFNKSVKFSEALGVSLIDGISKVNEEVSALAELLRNCDKKYKIPLTAVQAKEIEHKECVLRYGALSLSNRAPSVKMYFNKRLQSSIIMLDSQLGIKSTPDDKKKYLAKVQPKIQERAIKNFDKSGSPNYGELMKDYLDVRACDTQYGFSITTVPDQLLQAQKK